MWPTKNRKDFCFQKLGIFSIENENIVTKYSLFIFIFLILANCCTHKKKTVMQRNRNEPSKKKLGMNFLDLKNMIFTDTNNYCGKKWP